MFEETSFSARLISTRRPGFTILGAEIGPGYRTKLVSENWESGSETSGLGLDIEIWLELGRGWVPAISPDQFILLRPRPLPRPTPGHKRR